MSNDLTGTIEQINEAFTAFKAEQGDRLRLLEAKAQRPAFSQSGSDHLSLEAKAAFHELLSGKAMSGIAGPDGGFLVPSEIDARVGALVARLSPLRRVANIVNITSPNTSFPVNLRGTGSGWVGETDDRPLTSAPKLANVTLPGGTVYALPTVSEELVDDAIIDIESFLTTNVVDEIATRESQAFIFGDGVKKPLGFLAGPAPVATADATREFGKVQYLARGVAAGLGDLHANLNRMIYSLAAGYRQAEGCAWLMSTDMLATIGAAKDTAGRPLYYPATSDAAPATLLGYPVVECEHMPLVAAGAFPVAFGNWRRGYTIADRTPLSILRDPYSVKGYVSWYFRKRVHGGITNSEAIKLLKVAAN